MSRSVKKFPSHGIATGSNAEWKKEARQMNRNKNRQMLNKFVKGFISEDELMSYDKRWHCSDIWCEPTDGKVVMFNNPHNADTDHRIMEMFKKYKRK